MITRVFSRSFSTVTPGALFTWGESTYGWGRDVTNNVRTPGQVGSFNDVVKVAAGPHHLLFSRSNRQVYSVGLGDNGRLGHGNTTSLEQPEAIEALNSADIKNLAAGWRHSLALSTSGTVYAWGYGGTTGGLFKYLPFLACDSPTGFGSQGDVLTPRPVESIKQNVKQIAAGHDLSLALGQSGKVYGWGSGLTSLGEASSSEPRQLPEINYFLDSHHSHVKKIKSSGKNVFLLLDDGRIYVSGCNEGGVFGTRTNPRVVEDNQFMGLTKIVDEDFKGQKIVKFKVSANSLIFLTDAGEVYYSGMHLRFRPEKFPVQKGSVKTIFATADSVGVVDKEGRIGYVNDHFIENSEKRGNVFVSRDEHLSGLIKLGGNYKLRYAVVKN